MYIVYRYIRVYVYLCIEEYIIRHKQQRRLPPTSHCFEINSALSCVCVWARGVYGFPRYEQEFEWFHYFELKCYIDQQSVKKLEGIIISNFGFSKFKSQNNVLKIRNRQESLDKHFVGVVGFSYHAGLTFLT